MKTWPRQPSRAVRRTTVQSTRRLHAMPFPRSLHLEAEAEAADTSGLDPDANVPSVLRSPQGRFLELCDFGLCDEKVERVSFTIIAAKRSM